MPRDGTGAAQRHPDDIAIANDPILAVKHNNAQDDMVSMLNGVPTRDGLLGFTAKVAGVAGNGPAYLVTTAQMDAAIAAALPTRRERVFAHFSASSVTNTAMTYVIASNVITVTLTAHGHLVGHNVMVSGTTGGFAAQEDFILVTAVTANTFTGTLTNSVANTSGTGTRRIAPLISGYNCHSVCPSTDAGRHAINYSVVAPNTDSQSFHGTVNHSVIDNNVPGVTPVKEPSTTSWVIQQKFSTSGPSSNIHTRATIYW